MITFQIQVYLLAALAGLHGGESAPCLYEGYNFLVLVTPPVTTIAVAGPSNTTVECDGLLLQGKTKHYINDSMVTYLSPVFDGTRGDLWDESRFVRIKSSSPVNTFVHLSRGDGYTAFRSNHKFSDTYTNPSFKPKNTCKSFVAVVAYSHNTNVNGTIRVMNSDNAFMLPGKVSFKNGDFFGNMTLKRQEFLLFDTDGDLTGMHIVANRSIAVFSGSRCCENQVISSCEDYRYTIQQVAPTEVYRISSQYLLHLDSPHQAELRGLWNNGTTTNVNGDLEEFHCGLEGCQVTQNLISDNSEKLFLQFTLNMIFRKKYRIIAFPGLNTSLYIVIKQRSRDNIGLVQINNISVSDYPLDTYKYSKYSILRVTLEPGVHIVICERFLFSLYAFGFGKTSAYSFAGACVNYSREAELVTTSEATTPTTLPVTVTNDIKSSEDNTKVTTYKDNSMVTTPFEDEAMVATPSEDDSMVTTPSEENNMVTSADHGITSDPTSATTKDKLADTDLPTTTLDQLPKPFSKFCPYKNGKTCPCRKIKLVSVPQTNQSDKPVTEALLSAKTVGAKRRRKISIADNRPSSQALGMGSLVLLCVPFGFVLLMDLHRLFVFLMGPTR